MRPVLRRSTAGTPDTGPASTGMATGWPVTSDPDAVPVALVMRCHPTAWDALRTALPAAEQPPPNCNGVIGVLASVRIEVDDQLPRGRWELRRGGILVEMAITDGDGTYLVCQPPTDGYDHGQRGRAVR